MQFAALGVREVPGGRYPSIQSESVVGREVGGQCRLRVSLSMYGRKTRLLRMPVEEPAEELNRSEKRNPHQRYAHKGHSLSRTKEQ
jgi:hypothetical protein